MNNKLEHFFSERGAILMAVLLTLSPTVYASGEESMKTETVAGVLQSRKVTGTVVDENGQPMIGVSVTVSAGVGAVTNMDGEFTLENVPANAVLTFSYVGYQELKVSIVGKEHLTVVMQPDTEVLDEVVVVGYGVQKKSNVTGAISSVKAEDMKNSVITNAAAALQGKVSGVQVVNNSGAPGAAPTIRVRGYSSNGSSNPLYIVDGLKVSDISYLDPNSVQSMEILKDAATAAIYGAEAGNGVILITTKTGNKGKTNITFDAQWTFSNLAGKVDLMNASQYSDFYTEALGETFTTLYKAYHIAGTDTDWQDQVYETGKMQKYNVGFQGGNDQGSFFVSMGWMNNDGIVKLSKDYYRRLNGQVNASYKLRPWLEVGTSNTLMATSSATLNESNNQYGLFKDILLQDPLTPVYYDTQNLPVRIKTAIENGLKPAQASNGMYYGYSWLNNGMNPLAGIDLAQAKNKVSTINGSTYANITPLKNLVVTSRLGYTIGNVTQKSYNPIRLGGYFGDTNDDLKLNQAQYATRYYQWENFFNYLIETNAWGNLGVMGGMSYSDYTQDSAGGQTNQLTNTKNNFVHLQYSTNGADDYVLGLTTKRRQIAYYGRLSWDFMDRYYAQLNFRADSYDAAFLDLDHNWGYFPSVSLGWTFSNEDFMKSRVGDTFSYGKLRLSYGVNGSISNLGNYMYAATLRAGQMDPSTNTANMTYWMDGRLVTGVYPSAVLANPKLRWERSKQFDVGLDLRFFRGKLAATMDYYHKLTDGLLVQSASQYSTGTSTVFQNLGKVVNKGFELELDWKDQIGDFNYGIKAEIGTVKNLVKEYKGTGTRIDGAGILSAASALTFFEEGYPLWYIRGYKLAGVDESTGKPIYEDIVEDGEITDADRTNLGSGIPDFTYGLTLNASWKNVDVIVYGSGAQGNELVYGMISASPQAHFNRPLFVTQDRWTPTHTQASMPGAVYQINDAGRFNNSSAFVHDASFFKIHQIQMGYSLPKRWLTPLTLTHLRAYISLDNYFTFTDYPGSDPEVNASAGSASALALDYGGYPMSKSISFGFNVAF